MNLEERLQAQLEKAPRKTRKDQVHRRGLENAIASDSKIPISFGKTLIPLLQGIKSVTRRQWTDRHAAHFIKCYEEGLRVPAFDKDRRYKGQQVGWLKLIEYPYKSPDLRDINQDECNAEGFPNLSPEKFIEEFFNGEINTPVWVVRFEFTALLGESTIMDKITINTESLEDKLKNLEEELTNLEDKPKNRKQRRFLIESITNLRSFLTFREGQKVNNPKGEVGVISQLLLTPGGRPEIWVSWEGKGSPSPEQPNLLLPIVGDELSPDEESDRLLLERKIEKALKAFYEAGLALREIRDRRLYRDVYQTFEEYCRERFNLSRRRPYQLIQAADVMDNLMVMCTDGTHPLPSSERQIRPLSPLSPNEQREVWGKAIEAGEVTSEKIKNIVAEIRKKKPVPNPYKVGDIVIIMPKDNPNLRGLSGYWGVVKEVREFSCIVQAYDGEYPARIENLKELILSPELRDRMRLICERIYSLYSPELEDSARAILSTLGKINRAFLTELEDKLLKVLEEN